MNVCVGGKFGYKLKFIENNKELYLYHTRFQNKYLSK
jgi:hypothetical protein